MIDHISFSVNDFDESVRFYDTTLACLGLERLMTFESHEHRVAGYGQDNKPFFWIGVDSKPNSSEFVGKARGFHVAFRAPSIDAIQAWYDVCLAVGGQSNGIPGTRPEYHPGYYAAFIIDPNGYRIEAVLHDHQP